MIEVLMNQYVHIIEFESPLTDADIPIVNTKRKLEDDEVTPQKKKNMKTEMKQGKDIPITKTVYDADIWDVIDKGELYIFTPKGMKSSNKIAAFDMDGTLIKTKSGKVHPVDTNDWQIAFPQIPNKLREYLDKGFKIIILSNQAPIGNGRVKIDDFKRKIENILEKLNTPIQVYIATGKGFYRKPTTGMWKVLVEQVRKYIGCYIYLITFCTDNFKPNWASQYSSVVVPRHNL